MAISYEQMRQRARTPSASSPASVESVGESAKMPFADQIQKAQEQPGGIPSEFSDEDEFIGFEDGLEKAAARGGKYYKRVPKPGGGYRYFYSKDAYEKHQKKKGDEPHVDGGRAAEEKKSQQQERYLQRLVQHEGERPDVKDAATSLRATWPELSLDDATSKVLDYYEKLDESKPPKKSKKKADKHAKANEAAAGVLAGRWNEMKREGWKAAPAPKGMKPSESDALGPLPGAKVQQLLERGVTLVAPENTKKSEEAEMDPIDALGSLVKAGGQAAGHKYIKRVPKPGGGYKYFYDRSELQDYKLKVKGKDHEKTAKKLAEGIKQSADICEINPPVCQDNMGIERKDMPQLADDVIPKFLSDLKGKGINVEKGTTPVGQLKATQAEINADKVKGMAQAYREHQKGENDWSPDKKPIIISKDNYVLDGHHRWAATLHEGPGNKMHTYKVDLPMKDLLKRANNFEGVKQEGFEEGVKKAMTDPIDALGSLVKGEAPKPKQHQPRVQRTDGMSEGLRKAIEEGRVCTEDFRDPSIMSKGMHHFHVYKDQPQQMLPDSYLPDLVDAFIEEAYEHEAREYQHKQMDASQDLVGYFAKCIYNELLIYALNNKNLMRAVKKLSCSPAFIRSRLNAMGIVKVQTENKGSRDDLKDVAYTGEESTGLALSMDEAHKRAEEEMKKSRSAPLSIAQPETVQLEDDQGNPFDALAKANAEMHFYRFPESSPAKVNYDPNCIVHGRDFYKAAHAQDDKHCTCPVGG